MKKAYILDTNILLDNENAIELLKNGNENEIYLPSTVLDELDSLKKGRLKYQISNIIRKLAEHKDDIHILGNESAKTNDNKILKEIQEGNFKNEPIFISNDKILQLKSIKKGISCEEFRQGNPFQSESEKYTGFIDYNNGEELIHNCFFWRDGKLQHFTQGEVKTIEYEHENWKIKPRNSYQNAAFELINNEKNYLITIQSSHGQGKTYLALASALEWALYYKKYSKIYILKPNYEIGNEMGYLPGKIEEKMEPYFRPIKELLFKLHEVRSANRLFVDPEAEKLVFDEKRIEMLPINFLRGANIDDAFVIIDEIQNLPRNEVRTVLSRMGENVKCICTGDVKQVDNPHLTSENNGMNWIVKCFKNNKNYGHIVLNGEKSRGPIADMVRERGL